jgi:cobalamin biosynthesis protein CobD/CbiB
VTARRRRGRRPLSIHFVPTAVGLFADRYLGEPPLDPHPVDLFAAGMHAVHRLLASRPRDRDAALRTETAITYTAIGLGSGALAGSLIRSSALATYLAIEGQMVRDTAHDIAEALALGDGDLARALLATLVPDAIDGDDADITRQAVTAVAANTTRMIVGPAMWSAAGGARGAFTCRAAETLDSIQRRRREVDNGDLAARGDVDHLCARSVELTLAVPDRLTAMLVALVRPRRAPAVWRATRSATGADATATTSARAFAGALGLRLTPPTVPNTAPSTAPNSDERAPTIGDITLAVRLSSDVQAAFAIILLVTGAADLVAWQAHRAFVPRARQPH